MKDQYVGDIGDYGKYGLLRFLAQQGITVGVNWYLTPKDETGHGANNKYLDDIKERACDPTVFDALHEIVKSYEQEDRRVRMIQDADLIPNAIYYSDELDLQKRMPIDRYHERCSWYDRSVIRLKDADLVFADPDNGISYRVTSRSKLSEKYVFPEEIAGYYYRGKDVVFYCHKGRRKEEKWKAVLSDINAFIPDAKVFELAFHGGPSRSYVFVIHPEQEERFQRLLNAFVSGPWKSRFCLADQVISAPKERTYEEQRAVNWKLIDRFQKQHVTRQMKEAALQKMPDDQIQVMIKATSNIYAKIFYGSFLKKEEP